MSGIAVSNIDSKLFELQANILKLQRQLIDRYEEMLHERHGSIVDPNGGKKDDKT